MDAVLRTLIVSSMLMAAVPAAAATCAPKTEEIRDAQNRLAGIMRVQRDCTVEARDNSRRLLGRYYPRSRETRDTQGSLVGRGNALAALILGENSENNSRPFMSKCRYCNSTSYGSCSRSAHKKHEHIEDEKHCEFCGASSYGSCPYSPTRKHRHGSGANKCRWCGSTSLGGGCAYSPNRNHER